MILTFLPVPDLRSANSVCALWHAAVISARQAETVRIARLTAKIRAGLFGSDEEERASAAKELRILSLTIKDRSSLLPLFLEADLIAQVVALISQSSNDSMLIDCTWGLTNVASSSQTSLVVKQGAIPPLVRLLSSANPDVQEQAVWCVSQRSADWHACNTSLHVQANSHLRSSRRFCVCSCRTLREIRPISAISCWRPVRSSQCCPSLARPIECQCCAQQRGVCQISVAESRSPTGIMYARRCRCWLICSCRATKRSWLMQHGQLTQSLQHSRFSRGCLSSLLCALSFALLQVPRVSLRRRHERAHTGGGEHRRGASSRGAVVSPQLAGAHSGVARGWVYGDGR